MFVTVTLCGKSHRNSLVTDGSLRLSQSHYVAKAREILLLMEAHLGASSIFLAELAARHRLVIISPILERDEEHGEVGRHFCRQFLMKLFVNVSR